MPTAAKNTKAKRIRRAAVDSYTIRIGRHRDETYSTRTKCLGSCALSKEGLAVRPNMSLTCTHDQFTAVVHGLRSPHARPPVNPEGDRRERLARFCVGTPITHHAVPPRSNTKRLSTLKFIRPQVTHIKLQWLTRTSYLDEKHELSSTNGQLIVSSKAEGK